MFPFSEWIKVNNHLSEFNFRKIQTPNKDKFFITGVDSDKNNISFDMILNHDGKWNIVQPVPDSINLIKEQLINVIKKHS